MFVVKTNKGYVLVVERPNSDYAVFTHYMFTISGDWMAVVSANPEWLENSPYTNFFETKLEAELRSLIAPPCPVV